MQQINNLNRPVPSSSLVQEEFHNPPPIQRHRQYDVIAPHANLLAPGEVAIRRGTKRSHQVAMSQLGPEENRKKVLVDRPSAPKVEFEEAIDRGTNRSHLVAMAHLAPVDKRKKVLVDRPLKPTTPALKTDLISVKRALQLDGNDYRLLEKNSPLRNDLEVAKIALKQNGCALRHMSVEFRDNDELVEIALKQNGWALKFASERIRNSLKHILIAFQNDRQALQFAGQAYLPHAKNALKRTPMSLEFMPKFIQDNDKLVMIAVQRDGNALQFASQRLRASYPHSLAAANKNGEAYQYILGNFRDDPSFALKVLKNRGEAYMHLPSELKKKEHRKLAFAAVRRMGLAYQFLPKHFKEEPTLFALAITADPRAYYLGTPKLQESWKNCESADKVKQIFADLTDTKQYPQLELFIGMDGYPAYVIKGITYGF